ncbi:MAG: hypothetical protein ACETWG_09795 [Candidatus Neomarinimicrobiota bacterium]
MLARTLITVALVIWPLASLFSAEKDSPTFLIMGVLSDGSEIVNYDPINYQLYRSGIKEIRVKNLLGIMGTMIYDRVVINTSILLSYDRQELHEESKVLSYRLSNAVKIGVPLFTARKNILFPYLGIGLESLLIKTDLRFGVKSINIFFRDKNDYLIYNIAFLYGLAYDWPLIQDKNWPLPLDLLIGIDAGGMISKPHRNWFVNGKPESYDYAPEFDLRDFMLRVHLDFVLFRR